MLASEKLDSGEGNIPFLIWFNTLLGFSASYK